MQPQAFCRAVMHEYERQWSRGGGHAVRHPLRLKIDYLKVWCDQSQSVDEFEQRLEEARQSNEPGIALLAEELWPLWRATRGGAPLPFHDA
jgi:hypothetical protein